MRIAIVTEKPFMARRISTIATEIFPNDTLDFLICWPVGLYEPALPRGLRWQDYPHIAPFEIDRFQRKTTFGETPMSGPMVGEMRDGTLAFRNDWEGFKAQLAQADQIISLMDPGPSLYHFEVALRRAIGRGIAPGEARMLFALDDASIHNALRSGDATQDAQGRTLVAYGEVRHYFHYQFALNSLAILGRTLGEHKVLARGQRRDGAWISKYQLQLLYALRNLEPATEGRWLERMNSWPGTGRYARDPDHYSGRMGSAMSRAAIFDQVRQHGWVESLANSDGKRPLLTVSETGRAMLAKLHPGCEDADLPFRLDAWAQQGLAVARPAIDRYLLTFFGRQKRFLARCDTR